MIKDNQLLATAKREKKIDNRKPFTFKFDPDVITALRIMALKRKMTATALLEEAVIKFLKENKEL